MFLLSLGLWVIILLLFVDGKCMQLLEVFSNSRPLILPDDTTHHSTTNPRFNTPSPRFNMI